MARRRGWGTALRTLEAEWLAAPPGRYNIGIRFRCPIHVNGKSHWLMVYFLEPYDGLPTIPVAGAIAVERHGGASIGELTLFRPNGDDKLNFGDCGLIRIIRGRVKVAG